MDSNITTPGRRVTNRRGIPYPQVKVPGYGEVSLRMEFTTNFKKRFKEWWERQGRPWPRCEKAHFLFIFPNPFPLSIPTLSVRKIFIYF
ncbi:MAG: hypothetical protein ACE5KT_08130 [Methanosarcinales archaeon]